MDEKIKRQIDVLINAVPDEYHVMIDMLVSQDSELITQEGLDKLYEVMEMAKAERDK